MGRDRGPLRGDHLRREHVLDAAHRLHAALPSRAARARCPGAALSRLMAILLTVVMRDPEHERPADLRVLSLLRGALDEIRSKPLVWRLFLATAITQVGLWTVLPYVPIYIARLAPGNAVTAVGVVLSSV